ncbi:hypothetical protein ACLOJK_015093 [Asimina triloba]
MLFALLCPWTRRGNELELSELEERVYLINGCVSHAKYCYHMLGVRLSVGRPHAQDPFGTSSIMVKGERRKIIALEKRSEETGVEQVSREVLRSNVSISFEWELLEEALAKARSIARERLEVGHAREEAMRVEWDEVVDSVAVNREEALRFSTELVALRFLTELIALRSEVEALRFRRVDPHINGESSCTKLKAVGGDILAL